MKPFVINHNLCQEQDDILSACNFYRATAGNVGNSFIAHSVSKILYGKFLKMEGIPNIWQTNLKNYDVDKINAEYTHIILIMQDQIRNHDSYYKNIDYNAIANFFDKLKLPLITFSLGSNAFSESELINLHNTLDDGMRRIIDVISHKTPVIGVRGNYTAEVLGKLGIKNVEVVGCPSFYSTGKAEKSIRKTNAERLKIATTGSFIPYEGHHAYHYILQDQFEGKFIDYLAFNGSIPVVQGSFEKYLNRVMLKNNLQIFSDIQSWGEFTSQMDLVIGGRVHCSIVAINQGTPAIVTNKDFRAREMCDFFKIPYHPEYCNTTNLSDVYNNLDYSELEKNYPVIYQNFLGYLAKHQIDTTKLHAEASGIPEDVQPKLSVRKLFYKDKIVNRLRYRFRKVFKVLNNYIMC